MGKSKLLYLFKNLKALLILIYFFLSNHVLAQTIQGNLWAQIEESKIPNVGKRYIVPSSYLTLKLDLEQMKKMLSKSPMTRTPEVKSKPAFLEIPWPDGSVKTFQIIESPCMEKGLMEKFPEIKTYAGSAVDDHSKYIKLDLTPQGFHAMILTAGEGTVYIDPYSFGGGDIEHYICYFKQNFRPSEEKKMVCDVIGTPVNIDDFDPGVNASSFFGSCDLRTYRLALSATAEYTTFHGGTVALAQAAQATTMNRVNGVYERDMAVHMNIVANNNLIIYTNSGSDPFSNGNTGAMINENQTNTDNVIGSANYDIGHVFGTNSGGLAGLGVVCSGSKARGVTGSGAPVGDPFDIDYVAHEMGHQFDANHTQYNSCNRSNGTAMEPGSASTIMGYAGICPPDVQSNSDDHFHGVSLGEIGAFVTSSGGTCAATTTLSNSAPAISGTNAGVTVPGSTPFALTCIATDPNATDVLSYCWEQMDNTGNATQPPVATNTEGPNFRSNSPDVNPTRYLPNLTDLAAGVSPTWEVLSSVSRTMNFRVSVRDNAPGGGGCTDETDVTITVDGTSGPFVVTYPSATGITWTGNTSETVTWTVAGTDVAPVSCSNADIYLSTDGGVTYPTLLASNVTNDGSQLVTVPNVPTSTARIMVICSNGTFFDISDNNFTIVASTFDYTMTVTPTTVSVCSPTNATYLIDIGSIGGYSDPVTFTLTGVPAGGLAGFSTNPVTPVGSSTLTISNIASVTPGTYTLIISASSTSGIKQQNLTLTVTDPTSAVTLLSPLNGSTAIPVPTSFTWNAAPGAGVTYDIDIATDAGFSTIVDNATGLSTNAYLSSILTSSTTYYWRVRASNACGTTPFSSTFSFTTNNCTIYMSTDIPVAISASGTPTVTSTLNIPVSGTISDLNVVGLTGTHTWINDLTVTLANPLGANNILWSGICNNENDFDLNFDDAAASATLPCPPTGSGTYQPQVALSVYNGTDPLGNWTLTIADGADQDGGSLLTWGLQVCAATDYTLTVAQPNDTVCSSVDATYNIDIGQSGSYTDPVTLSVTGVPAPATSAFSVNPVTPNGSSVLTISNLSSVTPGTYNLVLNTSSTSGPKAENLELVVLGTAGSASLLTPADVATGVSTSVNISWSAVSGAGITYEIDIATDMAFSSIIDNATGLTTESYTSGMLTGGTTYYWRVRAVNACGTGSYSTTFTFTTSNCTTVMSTNVPVSIPGVGTGSSTLNFPTSGVITDVNVLDVTGTHNRIQQIQVRISSPAATTAILWDRICANENDFDVSFDDAAAPGALPCPPVGGGTYQSQDLLSAFNGEDPAGTWTLTVQDFNGGGASANLQAWGIEVCIASCALSANVSTSPVNCNGESNGSASVTITNGTSPYSFLWDSNAGNQTTSVATGLAFGNYIVTVTDGGCSITLVASVSEPTTLAANASPSNVNCFGGNDGSATITATGGTGSYTFDIGPGGQPNGSFNALTANNYTVTVMDGNSCTATVPVAISQPASALSAAIGGSGNPLCNNGSDGSVTATASGGTTNYSYNIGAGNQPSGVFSGLSALAYTITVTDANGCTTTTSSTLSNPSVVTANASPGSAINCSGGSDGTAVAAGAGGNGSFTYLWSNGQTNATSNGLSAINYTVTISDANGCSAIDNITLTDPAGMTSSASVTSDYNGSDVSCNGSLDGTAFASVTGGTGTYLYMWDNGQTNASATGLGASIYTVTITDGNSCITVSTVSLSQPVVLAANASPSNVNCFGGNDGSATITATGGTGSYTYDIGSGGQPNGSFIALTANNYTVTVTDGNSCTATVPVAISQPASALSAAIGGSGNPLCNNGTDGSVTATASGGTTNYSYNIGAGNQPSGVFPGLSALAYTITVTDANGCTTTTSSTLSNPSVVTANASPGSAISCSGGSDGTAVAAGAGGTGSFTYLWSNGQTNATANGLSAINYTVTISDANGCSAIDNITLTDPAGMTSSASVTSNYNGSDVSCNGSLDGTAFASVTGGTGTYLYMWNNGQTNASATGLGASTYTVTITDGNSCTTVSTVSLSQPASLTISVTGVNILCNSVNTGTATSSASGGSGSFTYLWSNNETGNSITGLAANTYHVTATDANGCSDLDSVILVEPAVLVATAIDNGNGTASANATGGTGSYSYLWDISAGNQTTATATGLTNNTTYSVTITDVNGCTATANVAIVISGLDDLINLTTFNVLPNPNNGSFQVQISFKQEKDATIRITNVLGQTLIDYNFTAREITIPFYIQHQASGVYFVILNADNKAITRKVTVLK